MLTVLIGGVLAVNPAAWAEGPPPPPAGVVDVRAAQAGDAGLPEEPEVPEPEPEPEPEPQAEPAELPPPTCRVEATFPGATWEDASAEIRAARPEAVAALEAYLFPPDLDWEDPERQGVRTDGVVVVHGGRIIYERYDHGYTAETRHLAWSMTKTVMGVLAGMAVGDGRLDPDESVCRYVGDLPAESCAVTVDHLLQFASGFDWLETYEGYSPTRSSVLAMLYGEGNAAMGSFVASHPLRDTPGTAYMYSSGDTNLLSTAVDGALRPTSGARWPHVRLFEPLGMQSAVLERDGADVPVGSSYWWATPRDMARFGLLLREDGCWQGERLVPDGWIHRMSQVNEAIRAKAYDRSGWDVQGRQLWINRPVAELGMEGPGWPHLPEDTVAALGHWKQTIAVIPSMDLVVVRTADDRDGSVDRDRFLYLAAVVAGEAEPLTDSAFSPASWPPQPPAPATDRKYASTLFKLGSGFAAKEACSCLFVAERDLDFCKEWVRVSPDVARFRVDMESKTVRARALGMGKQVATWVDVERGCRLER